MDAIRMDHWWPRILRTGALSLLWLSIHRGLAVEARGRQVSAYGAGPTTPSVLTSLSHPKCRSYALTRTALQISDGLPDLHRSERHSGHGGLFYGSSSSGTFANATLGCSSSVSCGSIENAICMGTWRNADSGSVLLYAITAWVILSLPACWRHRA